MFIMRDMVSGKEYKTSGYLEMQYGRLKAIERDTGDYAELSLDGLEVDIEGEYKPLSVCLDNRVLLYDGLHSRIGYPNSDVEFKQGYNWL